MPEAGLVEYEFVSSEEVPAEDLCVHFTPDEWYTNNSHLYYLITFNQEVAVNYSSI